MTRKLLSVLAVLCLAVSAAPPRASAQSAAGGAIEGTVTDQSGGVLPGVTITVRNTATGVTRETTTDPTGLYRAPLLPVGPYEVTAALSGFSTTKVSVVRIIPAIEAAFCRAERLTFTGSTMPALIMSSYTSVSALKP